MVTGGSKAVAGAGGSVSSTSTVVAVAGCSSLNYTGAACEYSNDSSDPSRCIAHHPASTPAQCVKNADATCSPSWTMHDVECLSVCLVCSHSADSSIARQACLDADAARSDHKPCSY